jgi:hypothetical protein
VPIRVYTEKEILLEGVMKYTIVNPMTFEKDEDVLSGLSQWLEGPEFDEHPVLTRRKNLFQSHIKAFQQNHWLLLELIAAHSAGPGDSTPSVVIEKDFLDFAKDIPVDGGERKNVFSEHVKALKRIGLIDSGTTGDRLAIGKQWWNLVLGQLKLNGRIE